MTTEDDALDSYQNLLFSIARFHEYTGRYPVRITVVGYEMKRRRFNELHRAGIRWPEGRFHYIGIDAMGQDIAQAREGEVSGNYFTTARYWHGLTVAVCPPQHRIRTATCRTFKTHTAVTTSSFPSDGRETTPHVSIHTSLRRPNSRPYLIGARTWQTAARRRYIAGHYRGIDFVEWCRGAHLGQFWNLGLYCLW